MGIDVSFTFRFLIPSLFYVFMDHTSQHDVLINHHVPSTHILRPQLGGSFNRNVLEGGFSICTRSDWALSRPNPQCPVKQGDEL